MSPWCIDACLSTSFHLPFLIIFFTNTIDLPIFDNLKINIENVLNVVTYKELRDHLYYYYYYYITIIKEKLGNWKNNANNCICNSRSNYNIVIIVIIIVAVTVTIVKVVVLAKLPS